MPGPLRIRLVLDGDRSAYRSREPQRGRVDVEIGSSVDCEALELAQISRATFMRGPPRSSELRVVVLFKGPWQQGERHSYAFEWPAPGFPPSYRGGLIELSWELQARVRSEGELIAEDSKPIALSLTEDAGLAIGYAGEAHPERVAEVSARSLWILAAMLVAGAAVAAAGHLGSVTVMMVVGAIAAVIALLGLILQGAAYRAKRKVGNVQAAIESKHESDYRGPGGEHASHQWVVWTLPTAAIAKVEATVKIEEHIGWGSGNSKGEQTLTVWEETTELGCVSAGEYRGPLPLPAPGAEPYSLHAGGGNHIRWRGTVTTHARDGTTLETALQLRARPARGAGTE